MNTRPRSRTPGGPGSSLFLSELRAEAGAAGDVAGMHRALHHAVTRLRGTGAAIEWVGAVIVPADARCLCLIAAAAEADVALAHDCAGLPPTAYQPVRAVSEAEPGPPAEPTTTTTTTTGEET